MTFSSIPQLIGRFLAFALGFLATAFVQSYAHADARTVQARAAGFNEFLGVNAESYLDSPVGKRLTGVRNLKTVLPGVLYRSGGPGGQTSLKADGLQSLCEAGFSKAYYFYPQGFKGTQTITCTGPDGGENRFTYVQAGYYSPAEKKAILSDVYERVQDGSKGPALVHCWNGYHASGEIAAVALMQFCDYDATRAKNYWMRNQNGAQMISRIGKFQEFPELRLTSDLQSVLCPRE